MTGFKTGFGKEGSSRVVEPPHESEMLSEPDARPEPEKIHKIEEGEAIPDPLDLPESQQMIIVQVPDASDENSRDAKNSALPEPPRIPLVKRHKFLGHVYLAAAIVLVILLTLGVMNYFNQRRNIDCSLDHYTDYSTDKKYIECMASAIASKAVGQEVHANCASSTSTSSQLNKDFTGWSSDGGKSFTLQPTMCQYFYDWLKSDRKNISGDQAYAIHSIIYLAIYFADDGGGNKAECKSAKVFEEVATGFGVSPGAARNWVTKYRSVINPQLSPEHRVSNWSSC